MESQSLTDAFEPGRLRLARELRGLSQAQLAGLIGLTPAAASQFESGSTRPSEETLSRISSLLAMPKAFFALPLVETHEGFFRSLRRTTVADRRRARAIAHVVHDACTQQLGEYLLPPLSLPTLPVRSLTANNNEIENLAIEVRRAWGVPAGPLLNVVELLEEHGLVVTRLPLETADVDAFSLPFKDRPVIVLGSDKNDRARSRFDAAHELGHLVMHGEEIWGMPEVEQQAHQFAAAFLMPREDIEFLLPTYIDWLTLFDLKQRWQVSLAALVMRAKTLERMSPTTYLTAVKAMSARGWRRVEPVSLGAPEKPRRLIELLSDDSLDQLTSVLPEDELRAVAFAS
jgi:Zn-dependent peptidase ImmA (M78 family)/DNA-binding XRE family transcriptional regulator